MVDNFQKNFSSGNELVIIGAGGHAVSVANVALSFGYKIKCFVDSNKSGGHLVGFPIISHIKELVDNNLFHYVIAVGDNTSREKVYQAIIIDFPKLIFPTLIHASAIISSFSEIAEGTVIMPQVVVGPNSKIGKFCILNTTSSIDHDCFMEDFSSVAPGVITGGHVKIGHHSAISIGAKLKHNIIIGSQTIVGGNSYVDKDLPSNVVAYGTPAKIIRNRAQSEPYLH